MALQLQEHQSAAPRKRMPQNPAWRRLCPNRLFCQRISRCLWRWNWSRRKGDPSSRTRPNQGLPLLVMEIPARTEGCPCVRQTILSAPRAPDGSKEPGSRNDQQTGLSASQGTRRLIPPVRPHHKPRLCGRCAGRGGRTGNLPCAPSGRNIAAVRRGPGQAFSEAISNG